MNLGLSKGYVQELVAFCEAWVSSRVEPTVSSVVVAGRALAPLGKHPAGRISSVGRSDLLIVVGPKYIRAKGVPRL